jgi:ferric-dicitrate binding protein FerR (iron transport regulator)
MKNCYLSIVAISGLVGLTPCVAQVVAPPAEVVASSLSSAQQAGRAGLVKQVVGPVWLGKAENPRAAAPGERLQAGERVSTGVDAGALLMLRDGTLLTLGPDTTVDLKQFQFDTTTQQGQLGLSLLQGSLRVVTGLLSKINPERFRIQTPTAIVGVRGTDFIVQTQAAPTHENPFFAHQQRTP